MTTKKQWKDCCSSPENAKDAQYGPAITWSGIYLQEINLPTIPAPGEMWAGNDEYSSQINYCPFCGKKAEIQIKND